MYIYIFHILNIYFIYKLLLFHIYIFHIVNMKNAKTFEEPI